MIRFMLVAMAAVAVFALPAKADVTVKSQDGRMELTLPNGWHELKPQGTQQIVATDGQGARVSVRSYSKDDFKDMKAVAGFSLSQLNLVEKPEEKYQDLDVGGKPAVRLESVGAEANGMRRGFIVTVFEAGGQYIDVVASSRASAFKKDQPVLDAFAKQIVVSGSSPPAASPTATTNPPKTRR